MKFLKTTVVGGLLFLVPVVAVVMVVGKALSVMQAVAELGDSSSSYLGTAGAGHVS